MKILIQVEQRFGLGPVATARLLGCPYSTYAQWKNTRRRMRPRDVNHCKALLKLNDEQAAAHLREVMNGNAKR